jgi:hypothetical protein
LILQASLQMLFVCACCRCCCGHHWLTTTFAAPGMRATAPQDMQTTAATDAVAGAPGLQPSECQHVVNRYQYNCLAFMLRRHRFQGLLLVVSHDRAFMLLLLLLLLLLQRFLTISSLNFTHKFDRYL